MKNNLNRSGILILIGIFLIFYLVTTFFLDRRNLSKNIPVKDEPIINENSDEVQKNIIKGLYDNVKIIYDVVNNKFITDTEDTITIGDIVYKKITNFSDVMDNYFTEKGQKKYLSDLNNYFAITENGYYLAGNLVNYQTYYFHGDETNIYITDSKENEITGIIYERWTTNDKNTLATIKVINNGEKWLIDDISILKTE